MKIRINYNLQCEVDQKKSDCNSEPPHCHIIRNGVRAAQVWLNPIRIQTRHTLSPSDVNEVIKFVAENKYELCEKYKYNAENGLDS